MAQFSGDYDILGYLMKYGPPPKPPQHSTDEFKLPSHITFSDESRYSGMSNGPVGGKWRKYPLARSGWSFEPSQFNLTQHGEEELRRYFKEVEPGNVLLPVKRSKVARPRRY